MGKRYDWHVTPQNTPHFRERRILFLTAMGFFVLNLILTGVFLGENMTWFLIAFAFAAFAVAQCFDNRREMWSWWYVIFWIVFSFVASAAGHLVGGCFLLYTVFSFCAGAVQSGLSPRKR